MWCYPSGSASRDVADVVQGADLRLTFKINLLIFDLNISTT